MDSQFHNLSRFVDAQEQMYDQALRELRHGRKTSHWIWFVFPQLEGLAFSEMSQRYAIESSDEAAAYLEHAVLGPRLLECAEAVSAVQGRSAHEIMGAPDDLKLKSCATLFETVSAPGSVFERILDKYFEGARDERTLELLA